MKTFVTEKENIEDRLDVAYYLPKYFKIIRKLKNHPVDTLGSIAKVFDGPFGSNLKSDEYSESGIPIFRVQNVKNGKVHFTPKNTVYITVDKHKELIRSEVRSGDVVITKTGWLGNAAVIPDEVTVANIRADLAGVRITSNKILPEYLAIYVDSNIGKTLIERYNSGSTRSRVVIKNMRQLPISIPDLKTQQIVIDIMESAYLEKQKLKKQSDELLDEIHSFIFNSLAIVDRVEENKLVGLTSSDEVSNSRFDPFYYMHPQDSRKSTRYKEERLGRIATLVKGKSVAHKNITDGNYPVIAGGRISPYSSDQYNYGGNVITASASGAYSGFVWYHDYPIFASDCIVIKSKNENEVSTYYIYCVLRAKQQFIYNMQQGAGQPHVYTSDLAKIYIPLPAMKQQNEISKEVKRRIDRSRELKEESKKVFLQAKEKVEEILFSKNEE